MTFITKVDIPDGLHERLRDKTVLGYVTNMARNISQEVARERALKKIDGLIECEITLGMSDWPYFLDQVGHSLGATALRDKECLIAGVRVALRRD
jgi:hypothetical protein